MDGSMYRRLPDWVGRIEFIEDSKNNIVNKRSFVRIHRF